LTAAGVATSVCSSSRVVDGSSNVARVTLVTRSNQLISKVAVVALSTCTGIAVV
jgi:hypothetical protein